MLGFRAQGHCAITEKQAFVLFLVSQVLVDCFRTFCAADWIHDELVLVPIQAECVAENVVGNPQLAFGAYAAAQDYDSVPRRDCYVFRIKRTLGVEPITHETAELIIGKAGYRIAVFKIACHWNLAVSCQLSAIGYCKQRACRTHRSHRVTLGESK